MSRQIEARNLVNTAVLKAAGLSAEMVVEGVKGCYEVLDAIDSKMLEKGLARLADLLEYAALSSVIGEVFAAGLANASDGAFKRNSPHKFPDLVAQRPGRKGIENEAHRGKPRSTRRNRVSHQIDSLNIDAPCFEATLGELRSRTRLILGLQPESDKQFGREIDGGGVHCAP